MDRAELQHHMTHAAICHMQRTLSDESKWSKKHSGEDANGNMIDPLSPNCVKWSIVGALVRARDSYVRPAIGAGNAHAIFSTIYYELVLGMNAYPKLPTRAYHFIVKEFNDHPDTTFADVHTELARVCARFEPPTQARICIDHQTESI